MEQSRQKFRTKAEPLTRGIKFWSQGGYASILTRIKFSVTRQDEPAIP